MTYDDLTKRFLFGGPVQYHNHRCHVVAMNDLLETVTLEFNRKIIPDVRSWEVEKYDEVRRSN